MAEAEPPMGARIAPAAARNRAPILAVLRDWLPHQGSVLEVAAGSGEHAVFFAETFPNLVWRPTDGDPAALASIDAWRSAANLPNLRPAVPLNASDPQPWPIEGADALVCINMIHISPWAACEGLMAGAGAILPAGGVLFLYGPFLQTDQPTAPSNLAFDADLKARNPAWGLRSLEAVAALAERNGLRLRKVVPMPANNLSVVFTRTQP